MAFLTPELMCLALFLGTIALLMSGFPVAFALAGSALIFAGIGTALGLFDPSYLIAFPQRIFAIMNNVVLVAVPLFVFMGVMLERSRVAEDLLQNMARLFGHRPGGLVFSVTLVGALLAASSGIVGATVVTMGLLSLPTMLKHGYSPALATGTIATSGTLGQIIPPSIVLVLLGDQLSSAYQTAQFKMGNFAPETVSVNDLFVGALLPGLMLVVLYLVYQGAVAWWRPEQAPAIKTADLPPLDLKSLAGSLFAPLILIIAVLGSILAGIASPTEVASVGAVGALMLAGYRLAPERAGMIFLGALALFALVALSLSFGRVLASSLGGSGSLVLVVVAIGLTLLAAAGIGAALLRTAAVRDDDGLSVLHSVSLSTMRISAMVFAILIGASLFSLVFRGFGGDVMVEEFLKALPGGAITAILLVMVVMFVLGFFLDFLEIIFIVVPIVAPILLQMEMAPGQPMNPVWLGVMMAVNLQMSFLTPPFGFSLFYLRGVAPASVRTVEIYRGVAPYVGIQLLALILLWVFPALATALPKMLYAP